VKNNSREGEKSDRPRSCLKVSEHVQGTAGTPTVPDIASASSMSKNMYLLSHARKETHAAAQTKSAHIFAMRAA